MVLLGDITNTFVKDTVKVPFNTMKRRASQIGDCAFRAGFQVPVVAKSRFFEITTT